MCVCVCYSLLRRVENSIGACVIDLLCGVCRGFFLEVIPPLSHVPSTQLLLTPPFQSAAIFGVGSMLATTRQLARPIRQLCLR